MKQIVTSIFLLLFLSACYKEEITINSNANDIFYVKSGLNSSRVCVNGNTASKIFLLFIHGGPGGDGLSYRNNYIINNIETRYASVYYDQRNSGSSQGGHNIEELTLDNMIDDIEKLITVLKQRYGSDIEIYMLAHSFGGLLSSGFMTTNDNQQLLKGWIYADGSHNYYMNDSLTRVRLISSAKEQIALGNNTTKWQEIADYCYAHPDNFNFKESMKYNSLAWKAMSYLKDDSTSVVNNEDESVIKAVIEDKIPITAYSLNMQANTKFARNLIHASYSDKLYKVNLPTLVIYGKKDFVCPLELGQALYSSISSTDKEFVISDISGHSPMDDDRVNFYNLVIRFIEKHTEL